MILWLIVCRGFIVISDIGIFEGVILSKPVCFFFNLPFAYDGLMSDINVIREGLVWFLGRGEF